MVKYFFLKLFFVFSFSTLGYASNKSNQLINAIQNNNIPQLVNYLEAGLNPDMRGEYGITPLMYAVSNHNLEAVKVLLKFSADVNATDIAGVSPLHIAARNGENDFVKLLLAHGANINAKDSYNMTPLMKATAANKTSTVELLIANNASVDTKDKFGYSASKMANKQHNTKIKSMLGEEEKPKSTEKQIYAEKEKVERPTKSIIPQITTREVKSKTINIEPKQVAKATENKNDVEEEITDMPWLNQSTILAQNNGIGRRISITAKGTKTSRSQKNENPSNNITYHKEDIKDQKEQKFSKSFASKAGTTVIKTKTRRITVGKAQLMNNDPIKKWKVTEMDISSSQNANYKIALHVTFDDRNQDFGDILSKVLRQTQYYKVKYQLVQNVKNNIRYVKISYFNSENFAQVYCNRILENKVFRTCKIVKVSNPRG